MKQYFDYIKLLITQLKRYKWLLLPFVPMIFLLIFLGSLLFQPTEITNTPIAIPTPSQDQATIFGNLSPEDANNITDDHETEYIPEEDPALVQKVVSDNSLIAYYFKSSNPSRPHLVIETSNHASLFRRTVGSDEFSLGSISTYKELYGEADRVIQGSDFYGENATISIYGSEGIAIIGNPQTDEVYEEHLFLPMTADEYISKFANQN
jgi:hypothetical protein